MKYLLRILPFMWLLTAVSYAMANNFPSTVMAAMLIVYSVEDTYK